ncbi:MAG: TonB-dependent receptor [Spirochaetota bacterium]
MKKLPLAVSLPGIILYLSFFYMINAVSLIAQEAKEEAPQKNKEKQEEIDRGSTITVTGTRTKKLLKNTTVRTELLDKKDIDSMGARTIADALKNVPGLEVRPAENGQRGETIRIQGLSAQNVLILVDGQRTTGRFNGAIDLSRFKVEDIERIEIVKGASSALYGSDAIAGVINIITKEAKSPYRGDFRTLYGTGRKLYYGNGGEFRNSGSIGIKKEDFSTQFTVGWHRGDGYDLTPDATEGTRSGRFTSQRNNYDFFPVNLGLFNKYYFFRNPERYTPVLENTTGNAFNDLNVSNKSIFTMVPGLKIQTTTYYRYLDQEAVDSSPPRAVFDRNNKTHDFMAAIALDYLIGNKWNLHLNTNYSRFLDRFTSDQRLSDSLDTEEVSDNRVTEVRSRVDYFYDRNVTVSLGLEALIDKLSSPRISIDCVRNSPYICTNELVNLEPANRNGNAGRQRNAVFAQADWKITDKVSVVPGLRHDNDSEYGGKTLPKLSLRYDPMKKVRVRFSSGLGYRAPTFRDLYFNFQNPSVGYQVVGNPRLQPELSKSYNLGVEWVFLRNFWLSVNLFYNKVDNLIGFRTAPAIASSGLLVFQTSNYKNAISQGVESSLTAKLTSSLSAGLGYTYNETEDVQTGLPLEGRGLHRGNLNLKYNDKTYNWGFSVFAVVFGKQDFYCTLNPFWCEPIELERLRGNSIIPGIRAIGTGTSLIANLPPAVNTYCNERNLSYCATEPTFGTRAVNAHTNINLRVYKKFLQDFEFFAGVDNMLEEFDVRYNPQKPRYFYFGVSGKFETLPSEEKKKPGI